MLAKSIPYARETSSLAHVTNAALTCFLGPFLFELLYLNRNRFLASHLTPLKLTEEPIRKGSKIHYGRNRDVQIKKNQERKLHF
jgi:hypothetical protein